MSRVGPFLLATALLSLLLSVFFYRLTIKHEVLAPADIAFSTFPWASVTPDDFAGPDNPWQSDDTFLGIPRRYALFEGPGANSWQDEYLTGTRSTTSVDFLGLKVYPPAWFYEVMSFPVANGFFGVSVLLVAGLSMYLLLRELGQPWLSSLYGGMLFMLSGHFVVWLGASSLPAILGLAPLIIFGFERARRTRQPWYLLVSALAFALQLYIAYIPAWVVSGAILAIYGIVRTAPLLIRREWRSLGRDVGSYAAAAGTGLLLSAWGLLPTMAVTTASDYQADRAIGLANIPLEQAWTFLFPDYYGGPRNWLGTAGNYPEWVAYIAISAVPLILLGAWNLRRSWVGVFALAVLIFSASQVYGIPPVKEVAHLPGMRQISAARWYMGLGFVGALVAPFGMTYLLETAQAATSRERRWLALAVVGCLALTIGAVLILWATRNEGTSWQWISEGRHLLPRPDDIIDEVESKSTHLHRQMLFLIAGGAVVIAALLVPRHARLACAALVLITFADIFDFGADYNATLPRDQLYPETPGVTYLKEQEGDGFFRVAPAASDGGRNVFPGFTLNLYGLRTITGYDHYRDQQYIDFLGPMRSEQDEMIDDLYGYVFVGSRRHPLNENLLSVLSTRYVVTGPSGLYIANGGQQENTTAFPVFGDVVQRQRIEPKDTTDAVEVLLATGGQQKASAEVVVRLLDESGSPVASSEISPEEVLDNSWHTIDLPDDRRREVAYLEVSSPEAPATAPAFAWGSIVDGWEGTREESGQPAAGALTFRMLEEQGDWIEEVYAGPDLRVYEVEPALPAAWGVSGVELVEDNDDAVDLLSDPEFDPTSTVILEEGVGAGAAGESSQRVEIEHQDAVSLTATADFSSDGYVVVSDRYEDAWNARVDGEDAEVVQANGVLMAVPVPAGEHTVELEFAPSDVTWGRRVTIATVVLLVVVAILHTAYTVRRRRAATPRGF